MPYLNEAGLAHYDPKLKEWIASQPVKTIPSSLYSWTLTEKAGAVTCWPVGGTPLLPTVDFIFTETPPVNGNKGPENPSTISGISSVTVTLCEIAGVDSTDYTLSLGSTYYGGSVDFATGVMTVTYYCIAFTGTENWEYHTGNSFPRFAINVLDRPKCVRLTNQFCTHFNFGGWGNSFGNFYVNDNDKWIIFSNKNGSYNLAGFKNLVATQYAAGTPITVVYEVAEPTTVQLSPIEIFSLAQPDKYTPRLNTIYTDAQAVQVGYVKSPIREEYELTQAIVAQGGSI